MNFLEQAARAERLARSAMDAYATQALMGYARECREMAARPADLATSLPDPTSMSGTALSKDTRRQLAM
jgi:hypothetical protein